MSLIDHIIPVSSLELIPARIYMILQSEFDSQSYRFANPVTDGVKFWASRTVPIDKSEAPSIVIKALDGNSSVQSVGSQHWDYDFGLEFICSAESIPGSNGYTLAQQKLERLMSAARYILMSPNYLTLGLDGIVEHTEVSSVLFYDKDRTPDAENTAVGHILFRVRCVESSGPNTGVLLAGSDTNVTLNQTNDGYQYGMSFTPPLNPRYVYIVDQYGNVLDQIEGGHTYEVTVIRRIIDTVLNNQVTITDNIIP